MGPLPVVAVAGIAALLDESLLAEGNALLVIDRSLHIVGRV